MDDVAFRLLLDRLNLDWEGYRKVRKGVKKRIRRHMRALDCRTLPEYLEVLDQKPVERTECDRRMTVSISRFFRDRAMWTALQERLLPGLIDRFPDKLNVWSAGCACGEEAYSFAIIWALLKRQVGCLPALELMATDTNAASLERARIGRYPNSSLKELPEHVRSSFFESQKGGKRFEIQSFLRQTVLFLPHNLLEGPPAQRFHFIFLRNSLLTYFRDEIKIPAFRRIARSLAKGGLLIIGSHEKVPLSMVDLETDTQFDYVLRAVA